MKWTSPAKASRTSTGALGSGVAVPVADGVGPGVAPRQTGAGPVDPAAHPASPTPTATAVSAASEVRAVLRITRPRVRAPGTPRDPAATTYRRTAASIQSGWPAGGGASNVNTYRECITKLGSL
ncbi:hypothetical protein [Micromonospora sp. IBHARD004]|uniref:hypothetical protein n=1 Tax=Micromonospora sp. IBHARD004 TaxID=3457764 RepID=UPI0040583BE0